jgi:hypothetical protein
MLTKKFIEHFGACLRALAERDGRPRSDHARFLLPLADCLNSITPLAAEKASLALTYAPSVVCEPPLGKQDQNNGQPECHP